MRVAVIGTSGAGKSVLARRLAARLDLPYIELDAINWQPGWRDLLRHDRDEFVRRVGAAVAAEEWVLDGNYGTVRDLVWRRATHLVWLDYRRAVIMRRVIARSLVRALLRTELWAGNRERWTHLLRGSHPIRFAWNNWARRRQDTADWLAQPDYVHLVVLHLRHPHEADGAVETLVATTHAG